MGRLWQVSVVVIVLTLGQTQAWAACAWVLWEEHEGYDASLTFTPPRWKSQVARETNQACEDVLQRVWRTELQHWQPSAERAGVLETKSAPGLIIVTFKAKEGAPSGGGFTKQLRCLPDTIDPRGPKGSVR